jgi:hypothetical protein
MSACRLMKLVSMGFIAFGVLWSFSVVANSAVSCPVSGMSHNSDMKFCLRSGVFIAAVGRITASTPDEFLAFARQLVASGLAPHSVTWHSPGGSLYGGITLGRMIRKLRLDTHVGAASECASACAFAFFGGVSRKVTHDGRIGNHQIRDSQSDIGSIQGVQDLIAYLSDYHREMNVSPLALTAAITRRSHEIYWYSAQERREWGIVTKR